MASINLGKIGIVPRGIWDPRAADYVFLDLVSYDGSSYLVSNRNSSVPIGILPTNTLYFQLLAAKGDKGDSGSTTTLSAPVLSASNISETSVSLLWNNVANATSYQLQRALNAGFTNGLTTVYTGSAISFNNTGLTGNTTYYYRIKATANGWDDSAYNVINVKTNNPVVPTLSTPVLSIGTILERSIRLNWTGVPNATSYELQIAFNSSFTSGLQTIYTGSNLTHNATGLSANTQYYFRVKAKATNYNDSAFGLNNAKTAISPVVTFNLSVIVTGLPEGYEIFIDGVQQPSNVIAFQQGTVLNDIKIEVAGYKISPAEIDGIVMDQNRTVTFSATPTTLPKLGTPAVTFASIAPTSLVVNWTQVPDAASYVLERAKDVNFAVEHIELYSGSARTFNDTGLTGNTQYYYRVKARATGYQDSDFGVNSTTTGLPIPTAPIVTPDFALRTLKATHETYPNDIVVSVNGAAYVTYTPGQVIDVGFEDRAQGYWKFKLKSTTEHNESAVVNSPQFSFSPDGMLMSGASWMELPADKFTELAHVWTPNAIPTDTMLNLQLAGNGYVAFYYSDGSKDNSVYLADSNDPESIVEYYQIGVEDGGTVTTIDSNDTTPIRYPQTTNEQYLILRKVGTDLIAETSLNGVDFTPLATRPNSGALHFIGVYSGKNIEYPQSLGVTPVV